MKMHVNDQVWKFISFSYTNIPKKFSRLENDRNFFHTSPDSVGTLQTGTSGLVKIFKLRLSKSARPKCCATETWKFVAIAVAFWIYQKTNHQYFRSFFLSNFKQFWRFLVFPLPKIQQKANRLTSWKGGSQSLKTRSLRDWHSQKQVSRLHQWTIGEESMLYWQRICCM